MRQYDGKHTAIHFVSRRREYPEIEGMVIWLEVEIL